MSKLKMLITQASFISVGILSGVAVYQLICRLIGDTCYFEWYFNLSVIFTGLLCSLPSLLLTGENVKNYKVKMAVHFLILFIAVSLLGLLFKWYSTLIGYLAVIGIFIAVYAFTWFTMLWIYKKDDKKINSALDAIRDKE